MFWNYFIYFLVIYNIIKIKCWISFFLKCIYQIKFKLNNMNNIIIKTFIVPWKSVPSFPKISIFFIYYFILIKYLLSIKLFNKHRTHRVHSITVYQYIIVLVHIRIHFFINISFWKTLYFMSHSFIQCYFYIIYTFLLK